MISITNGSHHVPTTKSMVNKDDWDTKKGTGKFMKNALYEPLGLKRDRTGIQYPQKIKPVPLVIAKLRSCKGAEECGSATVIFRTFYSNDV